MKVEKFEYSNKRMKEIQFASGQILWLRENFSAIILMRNIFCPIIASV
jgi:hypothetical protein